MKAWNGRAFAAIALALGALSLSLYIYSAGGTNRGFIPTAYSQPQPIRKLIEWLRGMTLPAGIVKAEGRIEATQVDVFSKYAGEVVTVAVREGDKVAKGQLIARMSSPPLEEELRAAQSDLQSAKEAGAQDTVKAAEAKVEQIKSMIGELTLVSPRDGKVQNLLAQAGDSVLAGASIVTLIDLDDVYMTLFLRAADAGKLGMGDEARLILDRAPDYVVPATVGFVASTPPSASNDELAKLMLRVDLKIDPKVLHTYYRKVETGLSGAGFVRTRPETKWPADLQVKLPPAPVEPTPPPVPAPVAQESAPQSAPTPAPKPEAAAPAPAAPPASAPAPATEASTSAPVAQEAKPAPPSPPVPAPPAPPAHAPAPPASTSAGQGPEAVAEIAPESLAQLAGAWTSSAADCKKIFQRRGGALSYRQPVDKFAQAVIIESQRIRLPTGVCRLERAARERGALKVSGECQDSISYTKATAYLKLTSRNELVFNPNGDPALNTSLTRCRV